MYMLTAEAPIIRYEEFIGAKKHLEQIQVDFTHSLHA